MADVFVGFFYDDQKAEELLKISHKGISAAANQYQKGFLVGLPEDTRIITTISTGTFPKSSKRLIFRREMAHYREGAIEYLPFVNVYFMKDWMFMSNLYRALKKIILSQDHTTVYVYSLNVIFEKVMERLKREFGNKVHYCLIIPDLPGDYGLVRKGIKGVKDRMDAAPKMKLAHAADSYVFLTEHMKELFPQKPHAIIEGFLPAETFDYSMTRIPKTILYTGSLAAEFGIQTLLEAFESLDDQDYRLWICGSGNMEEKIKQAAQKDPRILFKGFMPKKEIAALQTQCDVLVNPRTDEGEYTKYSFPSKTMEYLLSGSKVVMYRLPGIGDEYYQFIRTVETTDAATMARAIEEACSDQTFYLGRWKEQVRWIQDNKNAKKQVQKLLNIDD